MTHPVVQDIAAKILVMANYMDGKLDSGTHHKNIESVMTFIDELDGAKNGFIDAHTLVDACANGKFEDMIYDHLQHYANGGPIPSKDDLSIVSMGCDNPQNPLLKVQDGHGFEISTLQRAVDEILMGLQKINPPSPGQQH
mgnify:CR=1 FL=1